MPFGSLDYDFYTNVFLGRPVSPDDFPRLAARSAEFVGGLCSGLCSQVPEQDWPLLKFAVCAVIEILLDEERLSRRAFSPNPPVTSETVGNYSVHYRDSALSSAETAYLDGKKREAVKRYLSAVPALKSLFSVRSFLCMHHIR